MASERQSVINVVLAILLVCVIIFGVLLYRDMTGLESRVEQIEGRSRSIDVRIQTLETDLETMRVESENSGIVNRLSAFISSIWGFCKSIGSWIITSFLRFIASCIPGI
jgi:hypothetical protein